MKTPAVAPGPQESCLVQGLFLLHLFFQVTQQGVQARELAGVQVDMDTWRLL